MKTLFRKLGYALTRIFFFLSVTLTLGIREGKSNKQGKFAQKGHYHDKNTSRESQESRK